MSYSVQLIFILGLLHNARINGRNGVAILRSSVRSYIPHRLRFLVKVALCDVLSDLNETLNKVSSKYDSLKKKNLSEQAHRDSNILEFTTSPWYNKVLAKRMHPLDLQPLRKVLLW